MPGIQELACEGRRDNEANSLVKESRLFQVFDNIARAAA